jgi:hypothetical protein
MTNETKTRRKLGFPFASLAWLVGVAVLVVGVYRLFNTNSHPNLGTILCALIPMLLGTFLIVYSCKHAKAMHESGREVGEKALQSAKEGLRETLDSLKSVADATSEILSHELDAETKKAYHNLLHRLPELADQLVSRLGDQQQTSARDEGEKGSAGSAPTQRLSDPETGELR